MDQSTTKNKASLDILETENQNVVENDKLKFWQDKYQDCLNHYAAELANIDTYFDIYNGSGDVYSPTGAAGKSTSSVRKVAFELVESQVDVNIPMPKITSLNGNEHRAVTIENFIRNSIDKLDFEDIADEQARTVPIAGASFWLVEWDNSIITRNTIGKISVRNLDPKNVIPQKGIYNIDDMDYIFVRMEQSKDEIRRKYKIDVNEARLLKQDTPEMDDSNNDELVTHVFCYYKDENNRISLFSWVDGTIICDYDNYFARKEQVCTKCGEKKPYDGEECVCGNDKYELKDIFSEKITVPQQLPDGTSKDVEIEVPYYVPKSFPIIKRVNITKRGSFLGMSDVAMVKDQQNDLNAFMAKIKDKMLKGGSIMTIPEKAVFKATDEEMKIIRVKNQAEKEMFDVKSLQPSVQNDIGLLSLNYDIARQTIGVTNSFQGREDSSALSGKAKQASVEQVEGRFEPKKTMKNKSYADLFWVMFQFMLAYADEPRNVYYQDDYGQMQYKMFDKRMFIDKDQKTNKYYYDDEFACATDISSTLANNRQLMWQETRNNFNSGAYGDPKDINTIVMYWQTMASLHYPGAQQALQFATRRLKQQEEAQKQAMEMQQQEMAAQAQNAQAMSQAKLMDSQSKLKTANSKAEESKKTPELLY